MNYKLEICTIRCQLFGQKRRTHRVELCASIPEGTTPSYASIALARGC